MKKLSHINNKGEANMVDIQDKKSSKRVAIAEGSITLSKKALNQINDLEVLGPVDSPLLKIKKNFRSRLLIKFDNQIFMQKKITKVLNGLKISQKIKLTVDVDPINFA